MTKKHYEAIARDIRGVYEFVATSPIEKSVIRILALSLCTTFIMDNKMFDRDKFLTACAVEYEPEPK